MRNFIQGTKDVIQFGFAALDMCIRINILTLREKLRRPR